MEDTMRILHTTEKGKMLTIIENFYIHEETATCNQLSDRMTIAPNIFDTFLHHMQARDAI
jgi:hypothetical protein